MSYGFPEYLLNLLFITHVSIQFQDIYPILSGKLLHIPSGAFVMGQVHDSQVTAFLGQDRTAPFSDSAAPSGYNCHFTL